MTEKTKKNSPSASQKKLARLRQDYEATKAQVRELSYVIPGTLQKRLYRCGKPNCRCATRGLLHGPYYQWTRKIKGKTLNINLEAESAKLVREWIRNNRKLRSLCQRLEKISLAVLQASTNMNGTEQT